ncbi:hypothetical protein MMC34_008390 [Xylographa carneopallida]|nr:hypothetical protein [Xylographa carneopallida]
MIGLRRSYSYCYAQASLRRISTSASLLSGHNRWSKIKHDKAKVDGAKTRQRSNIAKDLTSASKAAGADPTSNTRLAVLIASAKKAGFPKASIDTAIARGQGISSNGAPLENVTLEVMLPHAVAAVIECQTDSKARLLQDLREIFKYYGANTTPTTYLFEKKGRIILESSTSIDEEELLEQAIGAGALDVDQDDDGGIVVLTEPSQVTAVGEALTRALGLKIERTEFIWDPKDDTKVDVPTPEYAEKLTRFTSKLEEDTSVQGIYLNTT